MNDLGAMPQLGKGVAYTSDVAGTVVDYRNHHDLRETRSAMSLSHLLP
jgi:hypothetical protein